MTRTRDVLDDLAEWYALPAITAGHGASAPRLRFGQPDIGLRSAAPRAVVRVVEALLAWHDRARERRALLELSDQMLKDLGISRAQAEGEAARPFWRV